MSGPITFANETELQAAMQRAMVGAVGAPAAVGATPGMVPAATLAAAGSPWGPKPMAAIPGVVGVLVPVNLPLPDGTETPLYLLFGPEHGSSPDALVNLVGALLSAQVPVKKWTPKQDGGGWGGGRGGRGGYGNNGGGRGWGR